MLRAYQSYTSGSSSTPQGQIYYHVRHAREASILSMMFIMFDERTLRAIMLAMFDERARRATSIFFVYRKTRTRLSYKSYSTYLKF